MVVKKSIDDPQCLQFVEDCLLKAVTILTEQFNLRAPKSQEYTQQGIENTMLLLPRLIDWKPQKYTEILCLVLDQKAALYRGTLDSAIMKKEQNLIILHYFCSVWRHLCRSSCKLRIHSHQCNPFFPRTWRFPMCACSIEKP